ncbi:unnamed protein product [Toxocara canis]|uniref:BAH domain-containing protein n=1 Tax=Toxocara canis TaxID=6265 RepID=A0A183UVA9_TOXCA|nr:unnamed protein product [Toxocara canis]
MLISSMSSPCVIGVISPNDIPTLDRHSDSCEKVSLYVESNVEHDTSPLLAKAPTLRIPSTGDIKHTVANTIDRQPIYQQESPKKSFALDAFINGTPPSEQNTPNMRKRHLFRIDDILANICSAKKQKLDARSEFHSNSSIVTNDSGKMTPTVPIRTSSPSKKEDIIHPPSPSENSSMDAEALHSVRSDTVPLLMVADPPSPYHVYPSKITENAPQNEPNDNVIDMDMLPCLELIENRPSTPLTPSLDPDFLRRLEEEDMPKRVLRSSITALTKSSKSNAAKRASQTKRSTVLNSSASSAPRKRGIQSRRGKVARKTPKKDTKSASTAIQYDPMEVKVSDVMMGVCAPSSSGPSSVSSASSCGSQRSRGGKKKHRTKVVISNWKPIYSGSRQYVYFNNDVLPAKRVCYKAVRHVREPETIHVRDSVVVKALDGTCNYGKVTRIFLDEDTGNLMASVLWYYNREQIETDPASVIPPIADKELFASRHIDVVPLDTIEEIIFVITFNEFARYMAENTIDALPRAERPREEDEIWSRGEVGYPRRSLLPCEDTPTELVSTSFPFYSLNFGNCEEQFST